MAHRFEEWNDDAITRVAESLHILANALVSLSYKLVVDGGGVDQEKFDLFSEVTLHMSHGAQTFVRLMAKASGQSPEEVADRMNALPAVDEDEAWKEELMGKVEPFIDKFHEESEPDIGAILQFLASLGNEDDQGVDGLA